MISAPRTGPRQYTIKPIVQEPPRFERDTKLPGSSGAFPVESYRQAVAVYRTKLHHTYETRSPHDEQDLSTALTIPDALSQDVLHAYGVAELWFPPQNESVMIAEYMSGGVITSSGRLTIAIDLKGFDLNPDEDLDYGPCMGQFFYSFTITLSNIAEFVNNEVVWRHPPARVPHGTLWKRFGQHICSTP
jgi:hypothetical protein